MAGLDMSPSGVAAGENTSAISEPLVLVGPRVSHAGGVDEAPGLSTAQRASLVAAAPQARLRFAETQAELEAMVEGAHVVAGTVDPAMFARAPDLAWVHSWRAGPNDALYPELIDSDVLLTSSSGNGAVPLAEHAIMLMLMLDRGMPRWAENQREHRWERTRHSELASLTCGIVGLGNIGSNLARMLVPFDMTVLGLRNIVQPTAHVDEVFGQEELHDFIARCDFIVVTAPLTPRTEGMFGIAEFRAMKRSSYFITLSRGGIADDDALLRALREGWIAGAGLDAHSQEPLPPTSPFWDAPNTIVTPHNGATTMKQLDRSVDIFAENLRRFCAGEPLVNVVDKHQGY